MNEAIVTVLLVVAFIAMYVLMLVLHIRRFR